MSSPVSLGPITDHHCCHEFPRDIARLAPLIVTTYLRIPTRLAWTQCYRWILHKINEVSDQPVVALFVEAVPRMKAPLLIN